MDEFEGLWQEVEEDAEADVSQAEVKEETPEYQVKDAQARYNILATILLVYYHAKHGESMAKLCYDQREKDTIPHFDLPRE